MENAKLFYRAGPPQAGSAAETRWAGRPAAHSGPSEDL